MKKTLVISSVLLLSILIVGCGKKDNTEEITVEENVPTTNNDVCTTNNGTLTNRAEGGDITVCAFDDDSFCFIEDLESGNCEKGFIFFDDEASETGDVEEVNIEDCETMAQEIVCGEDGNTYFNRCYLNAAGVAEETELAHVENGECIYG